MVKFGADLQPHYVDANFSGSEIQQRTPAYNATLSLKLHLLSTDGAHFALDGSILLIDGRYTQKFMDMKDFVVRPRTVEVDEPFWQGDPRLETMRLNVHVQSAGPLLVDVGWARINITTAALDVSNTLSNPRLHGSVRLEDGEIKVPFLSVPLLSEAGQVNFDPEKRIPDETPTLDVVAKGVCSDLRVRCCRCCKRIREQVHFRKRYQ